MCRHFAHRLCLFLPSVPRNKQLVYVIEVQCAFCEVGTVLKVYMCARNGRYAGRAVCPPVVCHPNEMCLIIMKRGVSKRVMTQERPETQPGRFLTMSCQF